MKSIDPFGQDWRTVVLHCKAIDKGKGKGQGQGKGQPDAEKDRRGAATMSSVTGRPAWKVEADVDGEDGHGIRRTDREDARAIVAARVSQKLSQVGLAQRLNLPVQVIRDIEAGSAPENRTLMARIRRSLGI